jgi:NAD(P)-dependent dehydrogenase (short-subunit alcohol dehydrogenase family)
VRHVAYTENRDRDRRLARHRIKTLQPMGQLSEVKDIVDAVVYLTEAGQVTGEVLHVDGGAHVGRW